LITELAVRIANADDEEAQLHVDTADGPMHVVWLSAGDWTQAVRLDEPVDLLSFLWRFNAAPRRYLDGFDERFGIDGPLCSLENEVSVEGCLAACADCSFLEWTDYPDLIADGFFVATVLDGRDIGEEVTKADAIAATGRHSCAAESESSAIRPGLYLRGPATPTRRHRRRQALRIGFAIASF
jgi:hypothetical protein